MTLETPTPLELELAEFEDDIAGRNVVAIGGGHGLAAALTAIRGYAGDTTAIVSVADDGGSSGRLTTGLGIPAPGDIRRCLLALTPDVSVWSELFSYRFRSDTGTTDPSDPVDVAGHSLGNLIIAALTDLAGDFASAVSWAGGLLGAMGRVIPAAGGAVTLAALVEGRLVEGQVNIAAGRGRIDRLEIGPSGVVAHPDAIAAIRAADQIVLGPGSLYTSVLAALAVPGIAEAVNQSSAPIVVVLNMVTEDGETLGLDGASHLEAFHRVGGLERAGGIVVHEGRTPASPPLDVVTLDDVEAAEYGWTVVRADVGDGSAPRAMHDPAKLCSVLATLI
ncbi:MAG: uridine diphosphate-N-acetylglucosamine-binding protein YvcK [Acidimicrobiia bacterium]